MRYYLAGLYYGSIWLLKKIIWLYVHFMGFIAASFAAMGLVFAIPQIMEIYPINGPDAQSFVAGVLSVLTYIIGSRIVKKLDRKASND